MSKKKENLVEEKLPTAKDFKEPKHLTPGLQRLKESTKRAMDALDAEIKKYGPKPDFRH